MTDSAFARATAAEHFNALNGLSLEDQRIALADVAQQDPGLAEQLEALLDAARAIEDKTLVPYRQRLQPDAEEEGRQVGQYAITGLIGSGGMASVYVGERIDGRTYQKVAIKIVHKDMAKDPEFVRRFIDERRILSSLHHPNIARIIDADELEDGRPYMIMDFVGGQRIDEALESKRKTASYIETVVEALIQIGGALDYAHQKLIVHGDVKPSNVLVDQLGKATLIDFGISVSLERASAQSSGSDGTPFTRAFASPEQRRDERIDARSDIYSFGALALNLLSKQLPQRRAAEPDNDPAELQSRSRWLPSANAPSEMARLMRGDIDHFLSKCLEEDPENRYGSMGQVTRELRAYLDQRPLDAVNGGPTYRWRKFVLRNKTRLALTSVLLATLLIGSVSLVKKNQEVRRQQAIALTEYRKAESVSRFMLDSLRSVDPATTGGKNLTLRQFMYNTLDSLSETLPGQPEVRAELIVTVGEVLRALSDFGGLDRLVSESSVFVEGFTADNDNLGARWAMVVAALQTYQDDDENALSTLLSANDSTGHSDIQVRLELDRINTLFRVERIEDASKRAAALVGLLEYRSETDSENYVQALIIQARVAFRMSDMAARTRILLKAKKSVDAHFPQFHPLSRSIRVALVRSEIPATDKVAFAREAVEISRRLNGEENIPYSGAVNALGTALRAAGEFDAAVDAYREVHAIVERREGKVHGTVSRIKFNLANALFEAGRIEEAFEEFRACLAIAKEIWPSQHHYHQWFGSSFGMHLNSAGRFEEAVDVLAKVHRIGLEAKFQKYDAYLEGELALAIARFALERNELHITRAQSWLKLGAQRTGSSRERLESQLAVANRLGMNLQLASADTDS